MPNRMIVYYGAMSLDLLVRLRVVGMGWEARTAPDFLELDHGLFDAFQSRRVRVDGVEQIVYLLVVVASVAEYADS